MFNRITRIFVPGLIATAVSLSLLYAAPPDGKGGGKGGDGEGSTAPYQTLHLPHPNPDADFAAGFEQMDISPNSDNGVYYITGLTVSTYGGKESVLWVVDDTGAFVSTQSLGALRPRGVNSLGMIVGSEPQVDGTLLAFLWEGGENGGVTRMLDPVRDIANASEANDIDETGTYVVGRDMLFDEEGVSQGGAMWVLDGTGNVVDTYAPTQYIPHRVNSFGVSCGRTGAGPESALPAIAMDDGTGELVVTALPVPAGAVTGWANEINEASIVTGWFNFDDGSQQAFIWDAVDGMMLITGMVRAHGINNGDLVVGDSPAKIFDPDLNSVFDLNDLDDSKVYLRSAFEISNNGFIISYGYEGNGAKRTGWRAYLQIPTP